MTNYKLNTIIRQVFCGLLKNLLQIKLQFQFNVNVHFYYVVAVSSLICPNLK